MAGADGADWASGLPISGIEAIDIAGGGDNTLTLNVMDVLNASDISAAQAMTSMRREG